LQQAVLDKKYDNQFPKYLREFLQKRRADSTFLPPEMRNMPVAIEIGLFASRLDGTNGYTLKLHDEKTGFILINDFNIERVFANRAEIKAQILEIAKTDHAEEERRGDRLTSISDNVRSKVLAGEELSKGDIKEILESENEKILKMREEIITVCKEFNIPVIMNNMHGHTLNIGVVGGGLVNIRARGEEVVLEQIPTVARTSPRESIGGAADVERLVGNVHGETVTPFS